MHICFPAEQSADTAGQIKDAVQEDGTANSEQGEEEMEVESEKEDEKPKAMGAFSSALSSLNVLRPGKCSTIIPVLVTCLLLLNYSFLGSKNQNNI